MFIMSFLTLVVTLLSILALAAIKHYASSKIDPREPPVISPTVPLIGHLLGMLVRGSEYFKSLGSQYRYPIFTLPILNSRLYVVTNPNLAAGVQRASKSLSFNPIIPNVTRRVLGFDKRTIELMSSDMEHGFVQEIQELVHAKLAPGESLDELTLTACNAFIDCLRQYSAEMQGDGTRNSVDFLGWVKQLVTTATANFLYGPENLIKQDPKLANQFWDFDSGIPRLLLGLGPSITAKKAYHGRETLVAALQKFHTSKEYQQAASLTKDRNIIAAAHGVTAENIARSDLSFLFAGVVNTSLASFWLILNIFSQSALLESIRKEIEDAIETSPKDDAAVSISIKRIVSSCPLLVSSFRETLRLYSDNFSTRAVLEDTVLADTYFLRKGAIVQISGGIIHSQKSIWGESVDEFEPRRFLSRNRADKSAQYHPAAFRAFGGGATLCPGRHFALNEIVGFVALVVLMFDVKSLDDGLAPLPQKQDTVVPIHILEPIHRPLVNLVCREKWVKAALELEA